MTPNEEAKAKECCKKGNACHECPLYNPKRTTTECYEFWCDNSLFSHSHKMTNFEKIKSMSIDELTLFLHSIDHEEFGFIRIGDKTICNEDLKEWLESEDTE